MSDYIRMVTDIFPEFTRYALIHGFAEYCIVPWLDQKRVASLSIGDRIDLPEKLSSTIHALRIGISGLRIVFCDNIFQTNVFTEMTDSMSKVLHECAGYSIYDMMVMGTKPHESKAMWIHHILTSIGPIIYIIFKQGIFFGFPLTITELTVPFVNVLWFMSRLTNMKPLTRQILLGLRAMAYIILRCFTVPTILWYAVRSSSAYVASNRFNAMAILTKLSAHQQQPQQQQEAIKSALASLVGRNDMIVPRWSDLRCFWYFYQQLPMPCSIMIFVLLTGTAILNILWTRDAVLSFFRNWKKYRASR
ncbi:hypothetical protein BDF19DRAFT_486294 [Syncephalis fuscata]|nr:hypothetical protein BDF19DRAFT_486294 [Syncephalis fuscata]